VAGSVTAMAYYQVVSPQPHSVDFHRCRTILGSYWVRYRCSPRASFEGASWERERLSQGYCEPWNSKQGSGVGFDSALAHFQKGLVCILIPGNLPSCFKPLFGLINVQGILTKDRHHILHNGVKFFVELDDYGLVI